MTYLFFPLCTLPPASNDHKMISVGKNRSKIMKWTKFLIIYFSCQIALTTKYLLKHLMSDAFVWRGSLELTWQHFVEMCIFYIETEEWKHIYFESAESSEHFPHQVCKKITVFSDEWIEKQSSAQARWPDTQQPVNICKGNKKHLHPKTVKQLVI